MIDRRSFITFSTLASAGLLLDESWLRAADRRRDPWSPPARAKFVA